MNFLKVILIFFMFFFRIAFFLLGLINVILLLFINNALKQNLFSKKLKFLGLFFVGSQAIFIFYYLFREKFYYNFNFSFYGLILSFSLLVGGPSVLNYLLSNEKKNDLNFKATRLKNFLFKIKQEVFLKNPLVFQIYSFFILIAIKIFISLLKRERTFMFLFLIFWSMFYLALLKSLLTQTFFLVFYLLPVSFLWQRLFCYLILESFRKFASEFNEEFYKNFESQYFLVFGDREDRLGFFFDTNNIDLLLKTTSNIETDWQKVDYGINLFIYAHLFENFLIFFVKLRKLTNFLTLGTLTIFFLINYCYNFYSLSLAFWLISILFLSLEDVLKTPTDKRFQSFIPEIYDQLLEKQNKYTLLYNLKKNSLLSPLTNNLIAQPKMPRIILFFYSFQLPSGFSVFRKILAILCVILLIINFFLIFAFFRFEIITGLVFLKPNPFFLILVTSVISFLVLRNSNK